MALRRNKFSLDKHNAKVSGVCAGIADYTGVNANGIRIGVVLVTLLGAFPWTVIAYGVTAWAATPKYNRDDRVTADYRH